MSDYGSIFKAEDIKKQLLEINKGYNNRQTFGEYYGTVDIARQEAEAKLKNDFDTAILDAYKANYEQQQAIQNSNLGEGFKQNYLNSLENDLMTAYDTYKNTYATNMQGIQEGYQESINKIDEEVTNYANNIKMLADKPYEYLEHLWNKYQEGDETLQKYFENDLQWSKFVKDGQLLTTNDLRAMHFDENDVINAKGTDFYDQMMNQLEVELGEDYSYYSWLSDNNPELYEWSQSNNLYNFTYDGTNMGTFKTLLGMSSKDEKYDFVERYGGLNKTEIDSLFESYYDKLEGIRNKVDEFGSWDDYIEHDRKDAVNDVINITKELEEMTRQLGLHDELGKQIGGWDKLYSDLDEYLSNTRTTSDITADVHLGAVGNFFKNEWEATKEGFAAGIGMDPFFVYSLLGAAYDTIANIPENIGIAWKEVSKGMEREKNKQNEMYEKSKKGYLDALSIMVKYVQEQAKLKQN